MEEVQSRPAEFMLTGGQEVREVPTEPPFEEKVLRAKLILEEALEFVAASGLNVSLRNVIDGEMTHINTLTELSFSDNGEANLGDVADAIGDISYVSYGAACSYGIDMEPVDIAIQEANMAKFGPGSYKREDGKVMKPAGWLPPDIQSIVNEQKK